MLRYDFSTQIRRQVQKFTDSWWKSMETVWWVESMWQNDMQNFELMSDNQWCSTKYSSKQNVSNLWYWTMDEWLWMNWCMIICHIKWCPEWLCNWNVIKCVRDGFCKPFPRITKLKDWHMPCHSSSIMPFITKTFWNTLSLFRRHGFTIVAQNWSMEWKKLGSQWTKKS